MEDLSSTLAQQRQQYVEGTKIPMSKQTKILSKGRTSAEFKNYGQRLYQEGIQIREKREHDAAAARVELPDPELTFRPQIRYVRSRKEVFAGL